METDSTAPFLGNTAEQNSHAALQAAWDKLYRARSILEAEQSHLRDDRIAMLGELEAFVERERAVSARELRIKQLELKAALEREEQQEVKQSASAIRRLTRAPFNVARSVFGTKK